MTYTRIPCCIETGAEYLPKGQYALTTLLRPLSLEPEWISPGGTLENGIYYGPNPAAAASSTLAIPLEPETELYFSRRLPLAFFPDEVDDDGILRIFPQQTYLPRFDNPNGLSWDPVASAFFLLSNWQEWVDRTRDVHGRFPYSRSILAHIDLPYDPMVDRYRRSVRSGLESLGWSIRQRRWNGCTSAVCITHDVDYSRKWRPGILYGETLKHVVTGREGGRIRGLRDLIGALSTSLVQGDPFRRSLDTMLMEEWVSGFGSTWFLKAGAHGPLDVDYPLERGWLPNVIDRLENGGFEIGLHPSYFAADYPDYLISEQTRLEKALSTSLQSVRSHYLRWFVDKTAQHYDDAGLLIDSSLGFAEQEGFRNGTTVPFQIYDLTENHPLDIWEMPLAVMDSTLFGYRDLPLEDGIDATMKLLGATREFGGVLVLLWHNIMLDPLGDKRIAPHFEAIRERLDPTRVYVAALRDALSAWLDQTAAAGQCDD